jgi:hypothetical protein
VPAELKLAVSVFATRLQHPARRACGWAVGHRSAMRSGTERGGHPRGLETPKDLFGPRERLDAVWTRRDGSYSRFEPDDHGSCIRLF